MTVPANLRPLATVTIPESLAVADLCVVEHGGRFHMWLATEGGSDPLRLSAASPTEWIWEDARPLSGVTPAATHTPVNHPFVLPHQRLWYLWYAIGAGTDVSVHAATSSHGTRWLGHMPAFDSGEWGGAALADPAVVRDREKQVWLMTHSVLENDLWRIGLSESHDLQHWNAVGLLMETWLPQIRHCRKARLVRAAGAWQLYFIAEDEGRPQAFVSSCTDLVWWPTPHALEGVGLPSRGETIALHPVSRGDRLLLYAVVRDGDRRSLAILELPYGPKAGP